MKRNYLPGEKVRLTVVNQRGKRLPCEGVVIGQGETGAGPEIAIHDKAFKNPPKLELFEELIEDAPEGLKYSGEIGGAVLVPDFLWVHP